MSLRINIHNGHEQTYITHPGIDLGLRALPEPRRRAWPSKYRRSCAEPSAALAEALAIIRTL